MDSQFVSSGILNIFLIGHSERTEMAPVRDTLSRLPGRPNITTLVDVKAAIERGLSGHTPDLLIICQSWPDEFSKTQAEQLLGSFPVSRSLCCFGAWCEADGRNRQIWPLSSRVAARTSTTRIRQEVDVICGHRAPLPITAARDESFEFEFSTKDFPEQHPVAQSRSPHSRSTDTRRSHPVSPVDANHEVTVAVDCPSRSYRAWLIDLIRHAGFSPVVPLVSAQDTPHASPAIVLWDTTYWSDDERQRMHAWKSAHPSTGIIGLTDFAHSEITDEIRNCGAVTLVEKLAPPMTILSAIEDVLQTIASPPIEFKTSTLSPQ